MPRVLPLRGSLARRQANAARSDERGLPRGAFNLARHLGGPAQMIDQRRMADGPLDGLKRSFFENRGVQRSPACVLAMGDQSVSGAEYPPVGFAGGEHGVRRYYHEITSGLRTKSLVRLKFRWFHCTPVIRGVVSASTPVSH